MLSGSQLSFLLETPSAASGSFLPSLSKSDNIQGCIKPRVKGPSFSSIANKSEISTVMCAAVEPMFNKGAVLKPEVACFASSGVILHFPFPKA